MWYHELLLTMKITFASLSIAIVLSMLVASPAFATVRKTGSQGDYFPMAHFRLEIDGVVVGGFKEVSGLEKEYTITKATPWKHHDVQGLDAPTLEFTSGEQYRMAMDLFFDGYEEGKSTRELTDKIEKPALVDSELHRPPTAILSWGTGLAFKSVLENIQTKYTLFKNDGTPVRAVMDAVWEEFSPAEEQLKGAPRH